MLYLSQKVQLLPYCEYPLEVVIVLLNFIPLSVLGVSLNITPWLMEEHSTKPLLLCVLPSHFFGLHCKKLCGFLPQPRKHTR